MKALSTLAQSVRASTTMAIDTEFKRMRAEGINVIGFSVGEPDFFTPEHIKQAGIRAIENNQTKYTPTPGTLSLRQAVSKRLQEDWGLTYTPEEIVVSGGGKPILYTALKTLLDPGDEVILRAPYGVSYYELIKMVGGVPVVVEFMQTGLVPKLPSALLAVALVFVGVLCFASGLILDTVVKGTRKEYELEVTRAYERYARR